MLLLPEWTTADVVIELLLVSAKICGLLELVSLFMIERRSDLDMRADDARDRSSGFRVPDVDELLLSASGRRVSEGATAGPLLPIGLLADVTGTSLTTPGC